VFFKSDSKRLEVALGKARLVYVVRFDEVVFLIALVGNVTLVEKRLKLPLPPITVV
jgi:hypothetical protein